MADVAFDIKSASGNVVLYESIKSLVKQYLELGMWSAALFWADKVLSLYHGEDDDEIYLVANCMLEKGEYHRAAHTIVSRGLHKKHLMCYYTASRALLEAKEHKQALQLLEEVDPENLIHTLNDPPKNRVLGAVAVVRGRVLGALERRAGAGSSFLHALQKDVHCFEALDYITRHHMLTPQQEVELLDSLPFGSQCNKMEVALLKLVYRNELNKYGREEKESKPIALSSLPAMECNEEILEVFSEGLENSSDFIESKARRLLRRGNFQQCLETLGPAEGDSDRAAELRAACLAELKKQPALFSLAHRLVDKYPESATSWFAVGCYYYIINKNELARRYFSKATSLDRGMGAAWLAYGHSFAADNEHDQAMAAYFKASQLMSGCHLPLLYIGLECGLTNNAKMADKFFQQALLLASDDPHVTHEMGVIAFQNQQYEEAERLWRTALDEIKKISEGGLISERWHPLVNNLGHACRKNGKYREAIEFHEQALTMVPGCGSTYAALGLCLALSADIAKSLDAFHSSLARKPDDTFASTMLTYLVDHLGELAIIDDHDVPEFPFPESLDLNVPTISDEKPAAPSGNYKPEFNLTTTSDMSMSFDD